MPITRTVARALRCVPLLWMSACVGQIDENGNYIDEAVGQAGEALVSTTARPPVRANVTGALPPLFPGRADAQGGIISAPADLNQVPSANKSSWVTSATSDQHKSSAAFAPRLNSALTAASNAREPRSEEWEKVLTGLEKLASFAGVKVTLAADSERFFGYTPEYARWMTQERAPNYIRPFNDPPSFAEFRQRGARLYCAAREAHGMSDGASHVLGRKSLASFSILGKKIDLLTLEPTVGLAAPRRFAAGANDGAQAFMIPLSVGARVAPISLLPTLPELRTPVAYVTGDSETASNATEGQITRSWQTAGHVDGFVSSSRVSKIDPKPITLFKVGPVAIELDMNFNLHSQSCTRGTGARLIDGCTNAPHQRVNRLLRGFGNVGAPPERKGRTTGQVGGALYNDDFWDMPASIGYLGGNTTEKVIIGSLATPAAARARQDNDKALEVRTGLFADMVLQAGGSGALGPFEVELALNGGLSAQADVVHTVREQMGATERRASGEEFPSWYGETSLSVTPHTEAALFSNIYAEAWLIVDLPFIPRARVGGEVFRAELPLTSTVGEQWDEENRLRIGTMGFGPDGKVQSHWPALPGEEADPFPAMSQSLATCMSAPLPTGDIDPPCSSVPGTYPKTTSVKPPELQLCAWAPTDGVDWSYLKAPLLACKTGLANFVKGGVSKADGLMRARVLDNASAGAFKAALDVCANALRSQAELNKHVSIRMCTDKAETADKPVTVRPTMSGAANLEPNACTPAKL